MLRSALSLFLLFCLGHDVSAQTAAMQYMNDNRPVADAHNCYPYDGRWNDRVDRALKLGYPIAIEQDLAWYLDPASGKGRVVVSHSKETNAQDPEERQYFFERVRPLIEKELKQGDPARWPIIILHFDFKDLQTPLLEAVWDLLGDYEPWITTALKGTDPHQLAAFDRKPILVLTEDADAQEKVFFDNVAVGARLRVFGSAHTNTPKTENQQQLIHLAATLPPDQLLTERPTNYRRWWNNSWYEVEEGGQPKAGAWTAQDMTRLRALVDHAHALGFWIRFYTLDGFTPEEGKANGWLAGYNFGSKAAAEVRWRAAIAAGVNLIATDQYEDLAAVVKSSAK